MDLISLKYFVEVAKELNFTKAANNLYSSQQCLSFHVKRLEDYYGVKLLERRPKVRLTDAGRILLEGSKTILEADEEMKSKFSYMTQSQEGSVRLGIPSGRAKSILNMALPKLKELYPAVNLLIYEGNNTRAIEERVLEGSLDYGVGSMREEQTKLTNVLDIMPLCSEKLYLLANEELVEKYVSKREDLNQGVYMKDLMKLPLVMDPERSIIQGKVNELFIKNGIKPNIVMSSNRGSSIIPLCTSGYCAIFMLEMILKTMLNEDPALKDKLCIIPLLDEELLNTVCLISAKERMTTKYLDDFKDILIENIPKMMLTSAE